jgi:hypothetical protein
MTVAQIIERECKSNWSSAFLFAHEQAKYYWVIDHPAFVKILIYYFKDDSSLRFSASRYWRG